MTSGRFALLLVAFALAFSPPSAAEWWSWRGPQATGVAPEANPPLTWSEAANVRWKVPIPGRGHSSPIVVGERVFLTTAIPTAGAAEGVAPSGPLRFAVLAFSRHDGSLLWERTAVTATPHEGSHPDGTWASASPVSDGERLYVFFGSRGLFAFDLDGKLLWERDLGDMTTRNGFGEGASPALSNELVLVNWDHEGDSFLVALDKRTGAERWRRERDEITSWSTPLVLADADPPQVVVAATGRTRGYALADGATLWEVGGMTVNVVPTPVYGDGHVYLASGFRGAAVQAVRLAGARGDLTGGPRVTWSRDADAPYVPTPLLYAGQLYFLKVNNAILTSVDAASGEVIFGPARLDDLQGVYASPVAAAGRIYVVGRNGVTAVLRHGRELEVLATNSLDDRFDATPALAGDALFLRGHRHLYSLASTPAPPPAVPATE